MESISSLTEMIINSLDYEKILKEKLQERNLEYILKLLLDNTDFTTSELFTFNNKEKIEKIIEEEIDDNTCMDIKIKTIDKHRFANIIMDIKAIKILNESSSDHSDDTNSNHSPNSPNSPNSTKSPIIISTRTSLVYSYYIINKTNYIYIILSYTSQTMLSCIW